MRRVLCLILNNEIPLLLDRLRHDEQHYDEIIVGEANKTFSGRSKPLFLERYAGEFQRFGKLRYVPILDLPDPDRSQTYIGSNGRKISENRWVVEHAMRNFPMRMLDDIATRHGSDCRLTVCDVDEIVHPEALQVEMMHRTVYRHFLWDFRQTVLPNGLQPNLFHGAYSIQLSTVVENELNISDIRRMHVRANGTVYGSTTVSPGTLQHLDGSPVYPFRDYPDMRVARLDAEQFVGWHLANMHGGRQQVLQAKNEAFSHAEYSRLSTDDAYEVPDMMALLGSPPADFSFADAELSPRAPRFLLETARFPHLYIPYR